MNWYRTCVAEYMTREQLRGYETLEKELGTIAITGNGANISIMVGGQSVPVRPILEDAVNLLQL